MFPRFNTQARLAAAIVALALLAAGCGKTASSVAPESPLVTPPPAPSALTQTAADDIAQQLGVTLARDFGPGSGAIAQSAAPALDSRARAMRAEADTSSGALSFRLTVRFFDADGKEQDTYDPLTTVRMVLDRTIHGYYMDSQTSIGMASHAVLDIAGIDAATDRTTMNGAADDTLAAHFVSKMHNVERRFFLVANGQLMDVVQLKPHEMNPYPLSGMATHEVVAVQQDVNDEGTIEAIYHARTKVTFNGTAYPEIEFEEGWRYRVDLNTGEIERVS
jgi:hypothetical protein